MNVRIAELREIADRLFTYLEETGRVEVEIPEDYYWHIEKEDVYDAAKDPKDITVGQLSEDWGWLTSILKGEGPPTGFALVWLSTILRVIGEKTVH